MAEAVGMGEGTIYPLMRRMQNDGLVTTYLQESGSGPPRKYYKLTKTGALTPESADLRLAGLRSRGEENPGRRHMNRADFMAQLRAGLSGLHRHRHRRNPGRLRNPFHRRRRRMAAAKTKSPPPWAIPPAWRARCAPRSASAAGKAIAAPAT